MDASINSISKTHTPNEFAIATNAGLYFVTVKSDIIKFCNLFYYCDNYPIVRTIVSLDKNRLILGC